MITDVELVAELEAERLRPVPPAEGARRPEEPQWMPDLRRLIAMLAEIMLEATP